MCIRDRDMKIIIDTDDLEVAILAIFVAILEIPVVYGVCQMIEFGIRYFKYYYLV